MKKKTKIIIVCICAFIIGLYAIVSSKQWQSILADNQNQLDTLNTEANFANSKYMEEIKNKQTEQVNEKPLYEDGVDAISTAWQKMMNADSVQYTMKGLTLTKVPVVGNVEIYVDNINIKHSKDVYSSISSGFVPIEQSQNTATQKFCIGKDIYSRETKILKHSNGTNTGTYSGGFSSAVWPNNNLPIVDGINITRDSVSRVSSYKVVRDTITNKILRYEVEASLNPSKCAIRYAESIKGGGGLVKLPEFKSISIKATILSNGNLSTMFCEESYDVVKGNVRILGTVDSQLNSKFTYTFSNYNKNIPYPAYYKVVADQYGLEK